MVQTTGRLVVLTVATQWVQNVSMTVSMVMNTRHFLQSVSVTHAMMTLHAVLNVMA